MMTDDLVKKLRYTEFSFEPPIKALDLMDAAADRIEQLEAALADVAQYVSRADWHYLKPETSAALGEKKDE